MSNTWKAAITAGLIVVAIVAFGLWNEYGIVQVWDGRFYLTLHINSKDGPPRELRFETYGWQDMAEQTAEALREHNVQGRLPWQFEDFEYDGRSVQLRVPSFGRSTNSGRELTRGYFKFLLLAAIMQDGSEVIKVVEIPDGRRATEMTVLLP